MRLLAPAAFIASLVVLGVASAAPGKVNGDPRATALKTARLGVSYAISLENNAAKQAKAGNEAEAKKELQNALHLLDQVAPEVKSLTPPRDFNSWVLPNSWQTLNSRFQGVIGVDERALTSSGGNFLLDLYTANHVKQAIYTQVDNEIRHPMCSELINLQGPVTVNGVPQGNPQLSVDVSCNQPEKKVIVVLPMTAAAILKLAPDGAAKAAILLKANAVQVVMDGAKSGGATMELNGNPAPNAQVDSMVVPIAGDSHPEFFDEVM